MASSNQSSSDNAYVGVETAIMVVALIAVVILATWFSRRQFIIAPIMFVYWLDYHAAIPYASHLGWLIPPSAIVNHGKSVMLDDYAYTNAVLWNPAPAFGLAHVTLQSLGLVTANVGALFAPVGALIMTIFAAMSITKTVAPKSPRRKWTLMGFVYKKKPRLNGVEVPARLMKLIDKMPKFLKLRKRLGITAEYERVKTDSDFMAYQQRAWRYTKTSTMFNVDLDDPSWRPGLTPVEWAQEQGITNADNADEVDTRCMAGFLEQIGKNVDTIDNLPVYARAVLAMCWMNRKIGKDMLTGIAGDLAEIVLPHQPFTDGVAARVAAVVDPILDKKNTIARGGKKSSESVTENPVDYFNTILKRHTGWRTAMVAAYASSGPFKRWGGGDAGVFPPNAMLWMKGVDRTLFYALTNVGAGNFFVEGAGPINQFKDEQQIGKRKKPKFTRSIRGIREYFQKLGVHRIDDFIKKLRIGQA